ncbi:oxidoreductase C-terminal domain-containing protein [Nonomuraea glycinis]|uniref:oxidoreductase C-terminal domain-containing protein n=1 Tax=Nonomuraea glycinis TaxID=2047744 RepID=UPI00339E345B
MTSLRAISGTGAPLAHRLRATAVRGGAKPRHGCARGRIQTAGLPQLADEAKITAGSLEEDRFAVAFTRGGVLVEAVAVNSPKDLLRLKRAISARTEV